MRLAAQAKGGFYPFHNDAVRSFAQYLDRERNVSLLDPCAGKGEAIRALAEAMGVETPRVWAVELEESRGDALRENLPGAHVEAPASFFDIKAQRGGFSLVFCNSPYDTEVGGGERVEMSFLSRSNDMLMDGGVLAYVVPETNIGSSYRAFEQTEFLMAKYEDLAVLVPRQEHRPYKEIIVVGRKRKRPLTKDRIEWNKMLPKQYPIDLCPLRWKVPESDGPRIFEKAGFTDKELWGVVSHSPLWRVTSPPSVRPPAEPPLPLSKGHIALLLASGHLDGVVHPPGEEPHVVRGVALKENCPPEVTMEETEDAVKTITTIKEKITLVIRAVDQSGVIRTFQ